MHKMDERINIKRENERKKLLMRIIVLDFLLIVLVLGVFFSFSPGNVFADIGDNVTVTGLLDIGGSDPYIISVDLDGGSVTLTPNATTVVNCSIIAEDYEGEDTIVNVSAELFHFTDSFYGDSDDNNYHYTNDSCEINTAYGDGYEITADCLFDVEYYANPGIWNCTVVVNDSVYTDLNSNTGIVNQLLAFGLPDSIDYGTVNATYVSEERMANVTNVGNVVLNLSLSGYGQAEGDGYSMVCDYGTVQNISIDYEKYNLTESHSGSQTLSQFEANYTNLTDTPTVRIFNQLPRTNDSVNDVLNSTYWRVYLPLGVAGTCNGTILFGAVQAQGT